MSENQDIESTDVEGHGLSARGLDGPDQDVEGHAARGKAVNRPDEDVEGHGTVRGGFVEDEDTEGHAGSRNF